MNLFGIILMTAIGHGMPDVPSDSSTYAHVDLEEVTVTELKVNKHNLTPSSISTVNSRLLMAQEVTSLKELTAIMPNFYMPDYGSKQTTPIFIRGIGAKTKSPAVGFYVDDIPHFENSAFDIDMNDIASVDTYRGPQGTLHGRNAIGGIISVHTYSPFDLQQTRFKIGYGSRNDVVAQFSNYTKLSDAFAFSTAGGFHHNDGFFRNHGTGNKADLMNSGAGRMSLVWKPVRKWMFRLSSMFDYTDQNGYPYGVYDSETNVTSAVNYNRNSRYRRLISTSGLNARYEGAHISFNSQTSYQFIEDRQGLDQDFTTNDNYYVTNRIHQNMMSQDFILKSNDNRRYQWIFGAFGLIQNLNNDVEVQYLTRDYSTPTHSSTPVYAWALYHQSSYNIWRGLSITLGARFDYEYSKCEYLQNSKVLSTGALTPTKQFDSRLHFNQFTPKFTLQYLITGNNLFYTSVVRGYKAGGFNQSFRTDDERTYSPEYNWNYEVGAKLNFLSGRLSAELALYYIDWQHQQVTQTVPGVGNILHNAGHSDSKGVELTLQARPVDALQLQLTYGYTYARFLSYERSATLNYSGNMLPMVPRNTLALNGSYTLRPRTLLVDRLVLSAGLTGIGKIYWAEDNAQTQPFYALLNAKISATKGIFTWEFWGKNLTDTKYHVYWFKSSAEYAQMGKPISWGMSVMVRL